MAASGTGVGGRGSHSTAEEVSFVPLLPVHRALPEGTGTITWEPLSQGGKRLAPVELLEPALQEALVQLHLLPHSLRRGIC